MTKAEFLERKTQAEVSIRRGHRVPMGMWYSLCGAFGLGSVMMLAMLMWTMSYDVPAGTRLFALWMLLCCLLALAGTMEATRRAFRHLKELFKDHALKCPACGKYLIFDKGKETAATGQCWSCGARLFEM